MANTIELSIAIPTYNRSKKLGKTLDSIIEQISDEQTNIEIVISDNCSTDDTQVVVDKYSKKYPFIKYYKNSINKGIDYNIFKCTDLSAGEYVHLLSDDDLLMQGSLAYILNLIQLNKDVAFFYLNGRGFEFDDENNIIFDASPVIDKSEDIVFDDKDQFVDFLGTQITFISAFLLHRETWNKNQEKQRFIGTDIYLSYDLIHLLANSNKYMFVAKDLISVHKDYTAGNYRIFYAFAYQWRKLLLEEAVSIGFNKKKMRQLFNGSIKGLEGRIKAIKQGSVKASLNLQALKNIVFSTYDTKVFWLKLLPALMKPAFVHKTELRFKNFRKKIKNKFR